MRASVLLISAALLAAFAAGLLASTPAHGVDTPTVEVSDDVELSDAAYTEQPRVSNLPQSGSAADSLAVFAAGAVVGGIAYAVTQKPQRIEA